VLVVYHTHNSLLLIKTCGATAGRARPRKPKPPARASRTTKNTMTRLKASVPRARALPIGDASARLDATRPNCRKSLTLAPPRAHSAVYFINRRLRTAPGERPGYGKSASRCYNGQPAAKSARTLSSQNSLRAARVGAVQRHDGRGSESA
jgi:hypothetical protein